MNAQERPIRLTKYSWNDCGGEESLIHVNSFIVSPDPVFEPGVLNLTASLNVTTEMVSPVKVNKPTSLTCKSRLNISYCVVC